MSAWTSKRSCGTSRGQWERICVCWGGEGACTGESLCQHDSLTPPPSCTRAWVTCPAVLLTCCLPSQPHHPPLPPMRPARPTSGPLPSQPGPGSSGSTLRRARPTVLVASRSPMLPMMVSKGRNAREVGEKGEAHES